MTCHGTPVVPSLIAAALLLAGPLLALQQEVEGQGQSKSQGQGQNEDDGEKKAAEPLRFEPMPIPQTVIERRLDRKIQIDGALDEWPPVMPIVLRDPRQVSGTALGAYNGASDLSGQMYALWDDEYLYVGIQVLDDWHRAMGKDTPLVQETPPIDGVLLSFDPRRDTAGIGDDPGRRDDRCFLLADIEEPKGSVIVWDRRAGTRTLTPGATSGVRRVEKQGLTLYEARIPWRAILAPAAKPAARTVFAMQVVIDDYDAAIDPLPQTRIGWNFGMGPQIIPGLWGSVMLVDRFDPKTDPMPDFPPPPGRAASTIPGRGFWAKWRAALAAQPPKPVDESVADPALAGGEKRFRLLGELDAHLQTFPRLDNLDFLARVQRRMVREVAGATRTGVPFFWSYSMRDLLRQVLAAPAAGRIRVFRLPQGGFYVRSADFNFAIDPVGVGVEQLYLQGGIDFVLLTRPAETNRRQDPLLIRMAASKVKRPFFTHLEFYLPGAEPGTMDLVKPGGEYLIGGAEKIQAVGVLTEDGKVTSSIGYLVTWKDGRQLMVAGLGIRPAQAEELARAPDVLILSALHGEAPALARQIGAKDVVLDDVFLAQEYPASFAPRVRLADALELQNRLKPQRSWLLAPGESVDL